VIASQTVRTVRVLESPPAVLGVTQTRALRDLFANEIFADFDREYGLDTALKRLAPKSGRRRRPGHVARTVRTVVGDLRDVAVVTAGVTVTAVAVAVLGPLTLLTLGPFAYELGV
jgi:hypothetical protein